MIEIRLATLVVIWFPKYLLRNKRMLNLKILYALGSATTPQKVSIENVKISINKKLWSLKFYYLTFYYFLLPTTFLLRIDIFISIASRILMTGQTCVLIVLLVHF